MSGDRKHGRISPSNRGIVSRPPSAKTLKNKGVGSLKKKSKPAQSHKSSIPKHLRNVDKKDEKDLITYVIDTNIIMHHTNAIFKFDEHEVVICGKVWEELDRNKKGSSDTSMNIRSAVRYLDDLVSKASIEDLSKGIVLEPPSELRNGKPHTGKVSWDFSKPNFDKFSEDDIHLDSDNPDHHVLAVCLKLKRKGKKVVLISNDKIFRVFAAHAGVVAEEYLHDVVDLLPDYEEDVVTGFHKMEADFWDKLENNQQSYVEDGYTYYSFSHAMFKNIHPNQFLVLSDETLLRVMEKPSPHKVIAKIITTKDFKGVAEPRNLEQLMALELLLDKDLPAVSIAGLAGSGKTFLAMAAAINLVADQKLYSKVIVTRSTTDVDSDEEIGFLPGTEEEKMSAWMGGIDDNLESLVSNIDSTVEQKSVTMEQAKNSMGLRIKSLNFLKGTSPENTLIIVDEAQDLNRGKVKRIGTRLGKGSKIIFLGNVAQIDNNFVTEHTCGISVLVREFIDSPLVGHITLQEGVRSPVATLFEERL